MKDNIKSPLDLHAETADILIQKIENIGFTAITDELYKVLAALKTASDSRWDSYRARLIAIKEISIDDIEKAINNINDKSSSEKKDNSESKPSVVDELVDMIANAGVLFTGDDGEAYLDVEVDSRRETYALQSPDIKEWVAYSYYRNHRRSPKSLQISDAINTAMGIAKYDGPIFPVKRRSAQAPDGSYLLDLCNDKWQAYRFTKQGYELVDRPEVRFSRSKNCLPLMQPEEGGTLADFMTLVNVAIEDLPLLIAALLEVLRPDTAYPVVEIRGQHGSAKSTTQKTVTGFFDPKIAGLRSRPKCVEDVFVAAQNSLICHYNNMSHISPDLQDAFCCLSTGGAWAARTLYTNGEETVFDTKRPVFINGIGQLVTQPDLLSRLVVIECPVISVKNRISDQEFASRLEKHGPKALHYLFSVFCKALGKLEHVELESLPRLADFARFGVSVTSVLREDNPALFDNIDTEPFMARYQKQLDDVDEQAIEGSPSIDALIKHLDSRGGLIESTVGSLFEDLRDLYSYRQHNWPKTARGFRNCIDRAMPALRSKGIEVIFHQSRRNGRGITLSSSLYRHEQTDGKRSSPTSPCSLQRVIENEIRSAHRDRELRAVGDHYSRPEFNLVEEWEEYEFWKDIELLACRDEYTPTQFLKDGGGLDI